MEKNLYSEIFLPCACVQICRHRSLHRPLLTVKTIGFSLLGLVSIQLNKALSGVRT